MAGTVSGGKARRAIVIGGSMSGLFAGLQLRKLGFDVDVYERAEGELAGRGAGIVAQPPVIAMLRALGIDPVDLGVVATTRKVLDVEGRVVCEFRFPRNITTARPD
jgi:2-polyprenyl-6-methoxyphenol hydroxylase-like FAD-dependent oxidoreductase